MFMPNATGGVMLQTMLFLAHQRFENNTLELLYDLPPEVSPADVNDIKCYGVYGCFPISPPWTVETRPISLYPKSPSEINPRFPVFNKNTKNHPKFIDLNDPDYLKKVGINPNGNIYFIIHGYLEAGDRPWIQRMVEALLTQDPSGTATIIIVDWKNGSSPPYAQAVANIRLVGAITAHVIHLIYDEYNLTNLNNFHIIGHSLGAHTAGYAGFTLKKDFNLTLGRITGLDPAEPLFAQTEPIVRLDRSDASFIDVIHTDAVPFATGGLGMSEAIGHVDFYPNGGYEQPGCDQNINDYIEQAKGSVYWGIQHFLSCNHIRSYQYFIESIEQKCSFMAISCKSYEKFKRGECFHCEENDHYCFTFGFLSAQSYKYLVQQRMITNSRPIKTYLITNLNSPFCRKHYRVTVVMSSSDKSVMHGGEIGTMSMTITANTGKKSGRFPLTQVAQYYEPGKNYTIITIGEDVPTPEYATLIWDYKTNPMNPLTWRILASPRVYVDYIILETMEVHTRVHLCPLNGLPVVNDHPEEFKNEYCRQELRKY